MNRTSDRIAATALLLAWSVLPAPGQSVPGGTLAVAPMETTTSAAVFQQGRVPLANAPMIKIRADDVPEGAWVVLVAHAALASDPQTWDERCRMLLVYPWLAEVQKTGAELVAAGLGAFVSPASSTAVQALPLAVPVPAVLGPATAWVQPAAAPPSRDPDVVKASGIQAAGEGGSGVFDVVWKSAYPTWPATGTAWAEGAVSGTGDLFHAATLAQAILGREMEIYAGIPRQSTRGQDLIAKAQAVGIDLFLQAVIVSSDTGRPILSIDPFNSRGLDCIQIADPPEPGLILTDPVIVEIRLGYPVTGGVTRAYPLPDPFTYVYLAVPGETLAFWYADPLSPPSTPPTDAARLAAFGNTSAGYTFVPWDLTIYPCVGEVQVPLDAVAGPVYLFVDEVLLVPPYAWADALPFWTIEEPPEMP